MLQSIHPSLCSFSRTQEQETTMLDNREIVAASIAQAQVHLEQAMADLVSRSSLSYSSVAFAAHALNNFLSVTGGATELMGIALADNPDPRVHTWLNSIQQATRMMAQIVASLMRDALVSGRPELELENVDLRTLLGTVCHYYQLAADRKGIRIAWIPPNEPAAHAWTDRTAVAAIMDNLLSNAIKYSPPSTVVWVTVTPEQGACVCSVRDEGPGISAADQANLYQRGVRLSAVPTGGEPSHGYGLAVAKELVELLGGSIWCESELGAGATFSFRLPAYRSDP
jgi:signal transduction histidine kinase